MPGPDGCSPDEPSRPLGSLAAELASTSLALARRFAAGATLWCWSPAWPHHAQHVAVEFVHPVIMGKPALPAEDISGPDPIGMLRAVVTPGDVLVAIASAAEEAVASAMRRAPAWGADTVWVGVGPRPATGAADHVLWLEHRDDSAAHTGELVLLYHLLWELTHVCLEHPGLVRAVPDASEPQCVTCSDAARVAEVVTGSVADLAIVRTPRGCEEVDTTLVGPRRWGDLVLVHAGTAIEVLAES